MAKENPLFPRYRADGLTPPYAGLTPPRFPQKTDAPPCAERPFSTSHRRGSAGPFPDPAACSIPQGEAEAPANPIEAPSPNVDGAFTERKAKAPVRLELVADAEGFIYAVAINGVTGKENAYSNQLDQHLKALSSLTDVPVLTGFGISTLSDVDRFNKVSSGVIVGSKIVRDLHEGKENEVIKFIENAINF